MVLKFDTMEISKIANDILRIQLLTAEESELAQMMERRKNRQRSLVDSLADLKNRKEEPLIETNSSINECRESQRFRYMPEEISISMSL